jgi:hypothetical protein
LLIDSLFLINPYFFLLITVTQQQLATTTTRTSMGCEQHIRTARGCKACNLNEAKDFLNVQENARKVAEEKKQHKLKLEGASRCLLINPAPSLYCDRSLRLVHVFVCREGLL